MVDRIPQPHHMVNDVMRRWPETMWLFMDHGMACAGCPVGAFHTVEEAALEYRIPLRTFLSELRATVAQGYKRPAARPKPPHAGNGRKRVRSQAGARSKRSARAPCHETTESSR